MASGYKQTEYAFRVGKCVEGFEGPAETLKWKFLEVEEGLKGAGKSYQHVKRLLSVSDMLAFKIWKLKKVLQFTAVIIALAIAALGVWAVWEFWNTPLVKVITVGTLGTTIFLAALTALGTALVGKKLMRVMRLRETLIRAAVGLFVGVIGSLVALIHLIIFDPWFIKEGSLKNYKAKSKSPEAPCEKTAHARHASEVAAHAHAATQPAPAEAAHAPAHAKSAVVETVQAGVSNEPLPSAYEPPPYVAHVEPGGGNGHALKPGGNGDAGAHAEQAGEGLTAAEEIDDPDARQN
jgi:hypothetical protein